jgi:hypothetical protein
MSITSLIDLLYEIHAMLQTDQVMLEGKALCLIGQRLDGAENGWAVGRVLTLLQHIFLLFSSGWYCQRNA